MTYRSGGPTEEGYHYTEISWWIEGGDNPCLYREISTASKDCDGPFVTSNKQVCEMNHLSSVMGHPEWQDVNSSQRDVYAERMGY